MLSLSRLLVPFLYAVLQLLATCTESIRISDRRLELGWWLEVGCLLESGYSCLLGLSSLTSKEKRVLVYPETTVQSHVQNCTRSFWFLFFFFGQGWSLPASAGIKACTTMLRGGRFLCLFYASNSYQSHVAILYVYCNWSFHFLILFSWRYLRLGQAGLCRTHIVPTFLFPMEAEFHTPYAALELTL